MAAAFEVRVAILHSIVYFLSYTQYTITTHVEQLSVIESLAVEFQRDPLTFCWINLASCTVHERTKWREQFGTAAPCTQSSYLYLNIHAVY